jgi:uncharacterized protein
MAYEKPLPVISEYNRPFWDYAAKHELRLQRCLDCGKPWFPFGPVCVHCFSERFEWARMSGRGKVHSWVVFHKVYDASFKNDVPYNVTLVEIEEGPRLISAVVGIPNDQIKTGMQLQVVFDDVADGISLPKFKPLAS